MTLSATSLFSSGHSRNFSRQPARLCWYSKRAQPTSTASLNSARARDGFSSRPAGGTRGIDDSGQAVLVPVDAHQFSVIRQPFSNGFQACIGMAAGVKMLQADNAAKKAQLIVDSLQTVLVFLVAQQQ